MLWGGVHIYPYLPFWPPCPPCSPPAQTAWTSATGSTAWTLAVTCSEKLFPLSFSWWTPACPSEPCSSRPSHELLPCILEQRALRWKTSQLWAFPPHAVQRGDAPETMEHLHRGLRSETPLIPAVSHPAVAWELSENQFSIAEQQVCQKPIN